MHYKSTLLPLALSTGLATLIAFVVGGCTGPGAYDVRPPYVAPSGGGGNTTDCSKQVPVVNTAEHIDLLLGQARCNDTSDGEIAGFYVGATPLPANPSLLKITSSATNVVIFHNIDGQPHNAVNMGPWSGSWPPIAPNPNATASPQGYDIGITGFATGILSSGAQSATYVANMPGMYTFGDGGYYTQSEMRTVIIVQ